jgi:hypothetical protein
MPKSGDKDAYHRGNADLERMPHAKSADMFFKCQFNTIIYLSYMFRIKYILQRLNKHVSLTCILIPYYEHNTSDRRGFLTPLAEFNVGAAGR